jgi:hypothetical protein
MAGRADDPAGRSPAVPSRFPAKNQRGSSLVIGFPDRQNSAERSRAPSCVAKKPATCNGEEPVRHGAVGEDVEVQIMSGLDLLAC